VLEQTTERSSDFLPTQTKSRRTRLLLWLRLSASPRRNLGAEYSLAERASPKATGTETKSYMAGPNRRSKQPWGGTGWWPLR
jgi:hypothetical protein